VERSRNQTVGRCVGGRSAKTFGEFFQKFERLDAKFYSDEWESYSKVMPADKLLTGKNYTVGIERSNSNVRRFTGRFARRTKVVSKSAEMVLATLEICWYINENNGFDEYLSVFASIFG
jgi:IS1 family transposase